MNGLKKFELVKKLKTKEYVLVISEPGFDYTVIYYFDNSFLFITIKKQRLCKLVRLTWRNILIREVCQKTDGIGMNYFLNFDYSFFQMIKVGEYIQSTWIRCGCQR